MLTENSQVWFPFNIICLIYVCVLFKYTVFIAVSIMMSWSLFVLKSVVAVGNNLEHNGDQKQMNLCIFLSPPVMFSSQRLSYG